MLELSIMQTQNITTNEKGQRVWTVVELFVFKECKNLFEFLTSRYGNKLAEVSLQDFLDFVSTAKTLFPEDKKLEAVPELKAIQEFISQEGLTETDSENVYDIYVWNINKKDYENKIK